MAKKKLEQEIEALSRLKDPTPENIAALGQALSHRNNYYVSKAAKIASSTGAPELLPALLNAYAHFFEAADPQCWAKTALARALGELGHDDSAPYLRGLRHIQMEPVWGGQSDTAGPLRATCALALGACRDLTEAQVFAALVDASFDADTTVRIEAIRALGRLGGTQAALLLRMRALAGDAESEVFGTALASLLAIEGNEALDFAGRYLRTESGNAAEAALAIATLRSPESFGVLKSRWDEGGHSDFRSVLLHAIALTRQEEATAFLAGLISNDADGAASALDALAAAGASEALRSRIQQAVDSSGNPGLRSRYLEKFG